jgi:hypothetical protein
MLLREHILHLRYVSIIFRSIHDLDIKERPVASLGYRYSIEESVIFDLLVFVWMELTQFPYSCETQQLKQGYKLSSSKVSLSEAYHMCHSRLL